mgnify:CR=1 FL=1
MRFTFRQLEYFVATGECGSIRMASERIHVSQPSISTAISQLEKEFGVTLFVRQHAQGLSLTSAGHRFLREAKEILSQADALYDLADELSDHIRGPFRVGCMLTLAPKVLPQLCYAFSGQHEDVRLSTIVAHHKELMEHLMDANIDMAVTYDLGIPEGVTFEPLAELKPVALVGKNSPLAKLERVSLEELAKEQLILLDLPLSREYFMSLFFSYGIKPKVHTASPYPEVIRTMVGNGYGYTLVNLVAESSYSLDGQELVCLELTGNHQPMIMGMAMTTNGHKTRLQDAFESFCRGQVNIENQAIFALPDNVEVLELRR